MLERENGQLVVKEEYDQLITLSPGGCVPAQIEALTGVSNQDIRERGIPKTRVCCDIARMIGGKTLLLSCISIQAFYAVYPDDGNAL